ncbi:MAG: FIST N-terminal domain-containing protein [Pseudomonadota bacterium]
MRIENDRLRVKTGETVCRNEKEAVRELFLKVNQPDMDAVIFFSSSLYDPGKLGTELKKTFPCPLIGCTTAGEISAKGYQEGGIVGASLSSPELKLHSRLISPLNRFGLLEASAFADELRRELSFSNGFEKEKMFGLLMIDGLSILEEQIISSLYNQLDGISIIGGSAGDDLKFGETKVYWDGQFVSDAAVFTLLETTLPFYVFNTQHFMPMEQKLVITGADPSRRIVTEINAEPAAREFARVLGLSITDLNPLVFSQYPLMLKIGDHWYVRSIQKVNEDESLSFFCAIDVGLVLTVAQGDDLVAGLKDELDRISRIIPDTRLIIGCDCILRKLEIIEKGLMQDVRELLNRTNFIGFSTYGEQYDFVHVNQTLTGVAIGG